MSVNPPQASFLKRLSSCLSKAGNDQRTSGQPSLPTNDSSTGQAPLAARAPRTWPATASRQSFATILELEYDDACSSPVSGISDDEEYLVRYPVVHPSWKTASFWSSYVSGDDDEEASFQHEENVTSELRMQALEFEKIAAKFESAAQDCRDLGQMQAAVDGYQNASAEGLMLPSYPFVPMVLLPWEESLATVPTIPKPKQSSQKSVDGKTTVMWRNLPNNYNRHDLLKLLEGFAGSYDFFYSPVDFTNNALVGYAFVNLVNSDEAERFFQHFQGFRSWTLNSEKVSQVTWSQPLQGLKGHIERYRNSPVMHPDVADARKPVLFQDGKRIPFPPATKKIRAPHLKECRRRA